MQSVEQIADAIIAREGGYVNDPDDPGGATKHGVTIGTLRRLGLDLDGNGRLDREDVRRLTPDIARRIFIDEYFRRPRINELPAILHATVFDMQVNAGSHAIRILQRLVGAFGYPAKVDGATGPKTIAAAQSAAVMAPDHLADAYGIERRNYYYRLADRRPASRKFARRKSGGKGGWISRAEEFISPKYHLSDAEHEVRVSAWD